jgi:hypothetical protein
MQDQNGDVPCWSRTIIRCSHGPPGALDRNAVEARRVLYARARIAQAGELRKLNPPLAELEIARERLALEPAIRKLEAES